MIEAARMGISADLCMLVNVSILLIVVSVEPPYAQMLAKGADCCVKVHCWSLKHKLPKREKVYCVLQRDNMKTIRTAARSRCNLAFKPIPNAKHKTYPCPIAEMHVILQALPLSLSLNLTIAPTSSHLFFPVKPFLSSSSSSSDHLSSPSPTAKIVSPSSEGRPG